MQVTGKLQAEIDKLKGALSVDGSATVDISQKYENGASKFTYHTKCDVSDLENDIPTTFEGALTVATSLPKAVKKTNDGKGAPITYRLLSLDLLRTMLNLKIKLGAISKQIEEHTVRKCFQIMQEIKKSHQQVTDLIEDFRGNKDAVSSCELDDANEVLNKFDIEEAKFKVELARALVQTRSGDNNGLSAIENVLKSFFERDICPEKTSACIRRYERTIQKLKLINEFKENKVLYIGKEGSLERVLLHFKKKKVYAFYMDYSKKYSEAEVWQKHQALFFRLISHHENNKEVKLTVIDCELQPQMNPKKMCVLFYENGILSSSEELQEERQDIENCLVEISSLQSSVRKPINRVPLEISCPKSFYGNCPQEERQWICKYCKEVVEYGIEDKSLYCGCGKSCTFDSRFRCNDVKHGLSFIKFDHDTMKNNVSLLESVRETNIILFGETRVGKTTLINSVANYIAFATLKDAMNAEKVKTLIQSQFSYTSVTGTTQTISIQPESAEESKAGQSTQGPKVYKVYSGNHTICFINIPGVGSTGSLEQNKEIFEESIAHLSYYNEIHGICILLKPNDSRLTTTFRFYITELLTHLHKSAAENIFFCFTNARSTFYRPGDTLPMLKSLLGEYTGAVVSIAPDNQFCFDNEAFRFLVCLRSGIQFNNQDIDAYSSSWDRAVTETHRLFRYIKKLRPNAIWQTVGLCNARRIIKELRKPLAETAVIIRSNTESVVDKSEELKASKEKAKELQSNLCINQSLLIGFLGGLVNLEQKRRQLTKEQRYAAELEKSITKLKNDNEGLEEEHTQVINICAQLASYLKKNTIIPYNDDIDSHLQMLIKQEAKKSSSNKNKIESWERLREKYEQQKLNIYLAMEQTGSCDVEFISEPGDMEKLQQKLLGLKHNSPYLKNMFEEMRSKRPEVVPNEARIVE